MNRTIVKEKIINLLLEYAPKVGGALVVLMIGPWIVKLLIRMIDDILKKSKIDLSLHSFIKSIAEVIFKIVIFITAASMLGVETTTFIAVLSTAGLAIGLALKDSLANFAGGILILTFRPFNVGDFIKAEDELGTVKDIQLLYTHINTNNNKRIIIPNSDLVNSKIINYSTEPLRRLDLVFSVDYSEDIKKVEHILKRIVDRSEYILKEPAPTIRVSELGDNSVGFTLKLWYEGDRYWEVYYGIHEEVKMTFDKENIKIPFPQREIHIHQEEAK